MGNSTKSLASIFDVIAAQGIPDPRQGPSGYGTQLALNVANRAISDLIAERFNWKWNSNIATPFLTNSFQQDYPQVGVTTIGWLEQADRVDINNTSMPQPLKPMTCRRQLSRCGISYSPVLEICWMYNNQLSFGTWPGAGKIFHPLIAASVAQNPVMSMIDKNGNRLIVTGFGTTGSVAPFLPASSAEGATIADGSVTWTVVSPTGQGFRVFGLPSATGPVYQITVTFQAQAPNFTSLAQLLNPLPDDYASYFQTGCECYALKASQDPRDKEKFKDGWGEWMKDLIDARKQGDRETDAYGMLPATSPVENIYTQLRNPQDPGQPY